MRYVLRFRHSDTGLFPTFTLFRKVSDLSDLLPGPTIFEIANGSYYFDYIPTFDVHFEVDGTAAISDVTIRYISDNLGPKDGYVDEPISLVPDAVWDEVTSAHATPGTYGQTLQLADDGTATAGGGSTITLEGGASSIDDFYKNTLLVITAGTGVGQARTITAYTGSTKVAGVDRAWGTNPDNTSQYMVIPAATAASGGSGGGSGVQFYANGDTVNPILFSVASPKHTQVRVTYSESVVMTTGSNGALNVANYSIAGLTISGIVSVSANQVLMTTSPQTPNFLYTLVVSNVEDLSGNPIL